MRTVPTTSSLSALKLAVVTGASRGIGLGFTRQLLERSSATIVATSRTATESSALQSLRSEFPGRIDAVNCDVTDAEQTAALRGHIKATHDGKDCGLLLNVAGLLHEQQSGLMPERSLASIDPAVMQRVMAVNAFGPLLMTQAVAPLMTKGAKIGNVSARVGSIADNRLGGWWSYRMSKAALNMCTVNTAIELRRKGIVAVSLHPGTTDTNLSEPFQRNVKPEKVCVYLCRMPPLCAHACAVCAVSRSGLLTRGERCPCPFAWLQLFTVDYSTGSMLDVLDGLGLEDSGKFFAYDGSPIEF